jgi:glycosyltransferase involved in cell wall biosynthesis
VARVVSLTPARLERDSRTLKEATTIAGLGHESIVVEAQGSSADFSQAPFALLTLRAAGEAMVDSGTEGRRATVTRLTALAGRVAGPLYFLASWAAFNVSTARRLPPADLYWVHGYEQVLAVWLRRRPYVYDAHDLYEALPYDGRRLRWGERTTHWVRARIEARCIRRARVCVTTSAAMARAYEARHRHPFRVIRNAQDARLARPTGADLRALAGAGPDDFLLVMVGQNKPGTVVPTRLPAGVRIAFVGDGYDGVPAPDGVAFVGSFAPEEIAALIASADAAALLYVPVNANSPLQLVNGLFHAVAAGLPLLLPAGMDAIRQVGEEHGLGVVVEPADPDALATGIAALRADITTLRANVTRAAPALSWEAEEAAVAAVLAEALTPSAATSAGFVSRRGKNPA